VLDESIDAEAARSFLDAHLNETVSDVVLLGQGAWSRAFAFRSGGRDLVARFGSYEEDFRKDRSAAAFGGPFLPIPDVLEIGDAFGGAFAISERHNGNFLERLDLESYQRLTPNLLQLFDALRNVAIDQDLSADWPADPSRRRTWHEWLASSVEDDGNTRVGGWRDELAKDRAMEDLYVRGVKALNARLVDCPTDLHLVHGDLLNRNVLVSTDAHRIEAVFDWGCSVYGDFLYDVAWFTFWAPWFPSLEAFDVRTVFESHMKDISFDVPEFAHRLTCYELNIGLTHLAYNTVVNEPDERVRVAKRTEEVLARRS